MDLLRFVLLNTNPGLAALVAALLGVLLVLSVSGAVRETDETTALELALIFMRRALIIILCVSLPLFAACIWLVAYKVYGYDWVKANSYMGLWAGEMQKAVGDLWWSFLVLLITPFFIRTLILRWVKPMISNWARQFRVKQSGDSLSDIRIEVGRVKPMDFNPRDHYREGFMLLGLDENREPIYMEDAVFRKNHLKVLGPSQTGKGVQLGVLLDQAIWKGWGAWFIDPKPDDFIPDIMREGCERYNRPAPVTLDLNGVGPGAYGPFIHGTRRERRERVVKAFTMADTGQTADFYKRLERQVLDTLMPLWDGTLTQLESLLKGKHPLITDSQRSWIMQNSGSLQSNTAEFMQLDTMRANEDESFNVSRELEAGSVVHIRSNMKDTIVRRATVALLDEIVQVALRKPLKHPIFLVVDECRFVVSDTLADALATVLSKNINMALAYQSINDLLNLPDKSLNAESIKTGIETNTQITLSYRANDADTAEWVSSLTGSAHKTVTKMEKVEVNRAGAEVWGNERSVGQVEENYITENQLLALPPRVCALVRPNVLSTLLYTCWIQLKEQRGMPLRGSVAPSPAQTAAISTSVSTAPVAVKPAAPGVTAAAIVADPFGDSGDSQSDPFASVDQETAGDPFELNPNDSGDDPFANAAPSDEAFIDEVADDYNAPQDDPFATPPAEQKGKKGSGKSKLSASELAAIEQAASGIINTKNKPVRPVQDAPAKPSVDLSSLDEIEGI